ncbi:hypothetical protein FZEAL_2141 [Fusarium zealandicum]|uniref:Uncharacterized protein n=1 Tax=Fusarium zealandicum TaxID=1053134 RepID=A0A8H4XNU8_9HYPO|nr:hypothetical protein FZEAL_2141 [Fusarium zealandicum]
MQHGTGQSSYSGQHGRYATQPFDTDAVMVDAFEEPEARNPPYPPRPNEQRSSTSFKTRTTEQFASNYNDDYQRRDVRRTYKSEYEAGSNPGAPYKANRPAEYPNLTPHPSSPKRVESSRDKKRSTEPACSTRIDTIRDLEDDLFLADERRMEVEERSERRIAELTGLLQRRDLQIEEERYKAQEIREQNEDKVSKQVEDLRHLLQEKDAELEHERYQSKEFRKKSDDTSSQIKELTGVLQKQGEEINQRAAEAGDLRKAWKKAAGELNKLRAMGQGFYQITDQYLVDLITQLRFNIRDFAIQFFDGNALKDKLQPEEPHYLEYLEHTTSEKDGYLPYLQSPEQCHQVIQAFIWKVLIEEVFNSFAWVGGTASDKVFILRNMLKPKTRQDSHGRKRPDPEAERKFQTWSATTVGLLLDAIDTNEGSDVYEQLQSEQAHRVKCIANTIGGWLQSDKQDFNEQITLIVGKAYGLGKEISQQVALVVWVFNLDEQIGSSKFDPAVMELEKGDRTKKPREVRLMIVPGVDKRGKSTGEGFKNEVRLLKAVVSCDE